MSLHKERIELKTDYDVIIVGAGPAGASCAKHLFENNFKVLVLERSTIMRFKPCAGLISERARLILKENFGTIPRSILCSPSSVRIKASKTGERYIEIRNHELDSVRRHEFDAWLINESKAEVREKTIYKTHRETQGNIEVDINTKGRAETLRCSYLVGADGGWSKVRKDIDPGFNRENFLVSQQNVYSGQCDLDPSFYHFLFNRKYSDLCCWFCVKDGLIYVGTSYKQRSEQKYLKILYRQLSREYRFRNIEKVRTETCLTDARFTKDRFFFGKGSVALAGEASGLINSFGEGIPAAINSGRILARSILRGGSSAEQALDLYCRDIEQEQGMAAKELKMMGR